LIAAALLALSSAARADGALSIGFSGDIARDGIAYGYANDLDKDAAVERALANCRGFKDAPKMAAICKLVTTFRNECIAVAQDFKTGTLGFGLAFGPTKEITEQRALALCQVSAGQGRVDQCKPDKSACDGEKK
jgi:hypothetical protein